MCAISLTVLGILIRKVEDGDVVMFLGWELFDVVVGAFRGVYGCILLSIVGYSSVS